MYRALRHSVIALLLAAVAGCGQMGPLYLPGEAPETAESAPVTQDSSPGPEGSAPPAEISEPATEESAAVVDAAKFDDEEG